MKPIKKTIGSVIIYSNLDMIIDLVIAKSSTKKRSVYVLTFCQNSMPRIVSISNIIINDESKGITILRVS